MIKNEETKPLLQSGVIPYRMIKGKPHIYLITSIRKNLWIVPKGLLEEELSPLESAILEAYEEAGIIGNIHHKPFGTYLSNKSGQESVVSLYPMRVLEAVPKWPEKGVRVRSVVPLKKKELKLRIRNESLLLLLIQFADYLKRRGDIL